MTWDTSLLLCDHHHHPPPELFSFSKIETMPIKYTLPSPFPWFPATTVLLYVSRSWTTLGISLRYLYFTTQIFFPLGKIGKYSFFSIPAALPWPGHHFVFRGWRWQPPKWSPSLCPNSDLWPTQLPSPHWSQARVSNSYRSTYRVLRLPPG